MAFAGNSKDGYTLTLDFIMGMIECFRKQQKIHRRFAFQIVMEVWALCLCMQPSALSCPGALSRLMQRSVTAQ